MGAESFTAKASGKTAKEAFRNARDEALYEYGHGGYTGSIAEKSEFEILPGVYSLADALAKADDLAGDNDKWGPALCLQLDSGEWLFFGTASS